jgi:hypothetical protein
VRVNVLKGVLVGKTQWNAVGAAVSEGASPVRDGTPGVSGVPVHNCGRDCWEGVSEGAMVEAGVGGGNGLINE